MVRTIFALVKKELYQIKRDPIMLRMIFIMPIIQLFLLGYAVSTDVKYINMAVYDYDNSEASREYIRSFSAGDYFIPESSQYALLHSDLNLKSGDKDVVLFIPEDFSDKLGRNDKVTAGLLVDGSNSNSSSIATGYANLITAAFNQRRSGVRSPVALRQKVLYNPEAESVYFIVPGIVATLLTMITMMLSSMAIVREREIGTLEQLMVTPIPIPAIILGKAIPSAVLGFVEISIALVIGILWFKIPFVGSWTLLYAISLVFLFTTIGMGMLISTLATTQQQAMFFSWFFSIFSFMTSGFFIPIDNMPRIVRCITYLNPLRYYMTIVRGIILKGAGIRELHLEVFAMIGFAAVVFSFSWINFTKRIK